MTPAEFEELMCSEPVYLEYQTQTGEERYKVLGLTRANRLPVGIWTPRNGKIRAITAYAATRAQRKHYGETQA